MAGLAAKAAPLAHRHHEIEALLFGDQGGVAVLLPAAVQQRRGLRLTIQPPLAIGRKTPNSFMPRSRCGGRIIATASMTSATSTASPMKKGVKPPVWSRVRPGQGRRHRADGGDQIDGGKQFQIGPAPEIIQQQDGGGEEGQAIADADAGGIDQHHRQVARRAQRQQADHQAGQRHRQQRLGADKAGENAAGQARAGIEQRLHAHHACRRSPPPRHAGSDAPPTRNWR